MNERNLGYLIVTDYVEANRGKDVSDELQKLILDNPNRTIYFPDGVYLISKPICTPANPIHSVSLVLSCYATIKATDDWTDSEALVRLGAAEPFNDINTNGSNYFFEGGILDGSGKANGISIDSGRETAIRKVSIKNTVIGIHIKWGANSRSSDADVRDVNIVGTNKVGSWGVLLEGHDNTLTNMRIASVHKGIVAHSGGNLFRNLHPLYIYEGELADEANYLTSVGFEDEWNDNFYDICYSDNFCTGFTMQTSSNNIYNNSYIMWYSSVGGVEVGFKVFGQFNSIIRSPRVNFRRRTQNALLTVSEEGGAGFIENPMTDPTIIADKQYEDYLVGKIVPRITD